MLISPILYMGNKKRLIKKGLIELFPKKIDTFYDLFGGSGIVSMNTEAHHFVLNDKCGVVYELYNMFKEHTPEYIGEQTDKIIKDYNIRRGVKEGYYDLIKDYNETKNILYLYVLMHFSFCSMLRFNQKGNFNTPVGDRQYSEVHKEYCKNGCNFFHNSDIQIYNTDYKHFTNFKENDFIYLDPPYLNTIAFYNDGNRGSYGWNLETEKELQEFLLELNKKNIKFGMSNVFQNKKFTNTQLINFCKENNLNVYTLDGFSYNPCGIQGGSTTEVYICNYEAECTNSQFYKLEY